MTSISRPLLDRETGLYDFRSRLVRPPDHALPAAGHAPGDDDGDCSQNPYLFLRDDPVKPRRSLGQWPRSLAHRRPAQRPRNGWPPTSMSGGPVFQEQNPGHDHYPGARGI